MSVAHQLLLKLRNNYLDELPSRLQEIEKIIIELEKSGFIEEQFNTLFRLVHSLKGSGGTYGLHEITTVCHPLEDILSDIAEHPLKLNKTSTDVCLEYVDLLRNIVDDYAFNDECTLDIESYIQVLRQKISSSKRSALIVERSSAMLGFLSESLRSQGVRVEVAEDGYSALGRILSEPFDFLITSMEVPRLNGAALVAALRLAKLKNESTTTILLTSNAVNLPVAVKPNFVVMKDAQLHQKISAILADSKSAR